MWDAETQQDTRAQSMTAGNNFYSIMELKWFAVKMKTRIVLQIELPRETIFSFEVVERNIKPNLITIISQDDEGENKKKWMRKRLDN